jgi:hypothetical protein
MKLASAAIAALALIATPAAATDYIVSFNSGAGTFTGTFTTSVDPDPAFDLVTAITGTLGGNNATLLAPDAFAGNDNLFSPTNPFFSAGGVSFTAGGTNYNIFGSGAPILCTGAPTCVGTTVSNFSVQAATAGVPEPATWAMMLLGFGAIGLGLRLRWRKVAQPA